RASSTRTDTVSAKSARADVNNAYATSADVTSAGAMPVFRLREPHAGQASVPPPSPADPATEDATEPLCVPPDKR
ncbi:MAG: hypothetical protein ABSF53_27480, partial [Terracidiphilus sp.]